MKEYHQVLLLTGTESMMIMFALVNFIIQKKKIYIRYALYFACTLIGQYLMAQKFEGNGLIISFVDSLTFLLLVLIFKDIPYVCNSPIIKLRWFYIALSFEFLMALIINILFDVPADFFSWRFVCLLSSIFLFLSKPKYAFHKTHLDFMIGLLVYILGIFAAIILKNYSFFNYSASFEIGFVRICLIIQGVFMITSIINILDEVSREKEQIVEKIEVYKQESIAQDIKIKQLKTQIGQNLHDDIGSQLTVISTLSQAASRLIGNDDIKAKRYLSKIQDMTFEASDSMRLIVLDQNQPMITPNNFNQLVEEIPLFLFENTSIDYVISLPAVKCPEYYTDEVLTQIYLIYKEILVNIKRHAKATQVMITISVRNERLYLNISDNGIGFSSELSREGYGLISMKNRIQKIKGKINICSELHDGTSIMIEV